MHYEIEISVIGGNAKLHFSLCSTNKNISGKVIDVKDGFAFGRYDKRKGSSRL